MYKVGQLNCGFARVQWQKKIAHENLQTAWNVFIPRLMTELKAKLPIRILKMKKKKARAWQYNETQLEKLHKIFTLLYDVYMMVNKTLGYLTVLL